MAEQKSKRFFLRLSPSERAHLVKLAESVGITPSAYIRMLLMNEKPGAASDQKLARQALADIARMGNNINQIAKHLNQGQAVRSEQIKPVLKGAQNAIQEATDQLCRLLERRTR